jgi:GTPase SAR1 family protein
MDTETWYTTINSRRILPTNLTMKSSQEYKPTLSFGLLLMGPAKSGKTTLALQFPKPFVADCDNNLSGPTELLLSKGYPSFFYDTINVAEDGSERKSNYRWEHLTKVVKEAVASPEVETIVIDSLSSVSDYLIEHVLRVEGQNTMRIQDWQPFQYMLKRLITFVRSSGKKFIMTCHETVELDELDKIHKHFIHVPTRLRDSLGGFFSDVWRMEIEKKGDNYTYQIRTKPTVRFALGTSILNMPIILPSDFKEILKHAPQLA